MIKALTKSRSASYHRQTMFKIVVLAAVAALFWTSTPAREATADVLQSAAETIRPEREQGVTIRW